MFNDNVVISPRRFMLHCMVAQAAEAKTQLQKDTKDLEAAKQHLLALDRCVL